MRGIRVRATALVTLTLAVALLVGGVAITSVLRGQLTQNLDATLSAAAADRASLLAEGAEPAALTTTQLRESSVWIGTGDGTTLATGGQVTFSEPITGLTADDLGTTRTETLEYTEAHDEAFETSREQLRLAIDGAVDPDLGEVFVVVASELETIDTPVNDVARLLLFGAPLLLILVGGLTWFTADRALRPVEAIRSSAENVRNHRDGPGIDVPSTGDEIERLGVTVNEMVGRLARADERQRQFVADASHELKSPLANLRIDIETAHPGDDHQALHLGQIDRLTAIVDDLLALAANDEDRPIAQGPVDLDDIVFDALAAAAPGHQCEVDFDGVTPTRLTGDASQLRRLVLNLIDNATRHADRRVVVMLSSTDRYATLHVDDDGAGVPESARETIFERFGRSDEARDRNAGGTGLGLAIVSQIAQRHGGTVAVTDSPLGGARFTVKLPNTPG